MRRVNPPKRKPKPRRAVPAPTICHHCGQPFYIDPDDITIEGIYATNGERVATRRTTACPHCLGEIRV